MNLSMKTDDQAEMPLSEGSPEHSPVKQPEATKSNNFVRSRFIIKRLKRMRSKARSLHEPLQGSYSLNSTDSTAIDSSASYESLLMAKDSNILKNGMFHRIYSDNVDDLSRQNKERLKEKIMFEEPEYAEPLDERQLISGKPAQIMENRKENEENFFTKMSDAVSFTSADSFEFNCEDYEECVGLLEAIEESLPKQCSLKKRLYCLHSVTMYRALLRLKRQPFFPLPTTHSLRKCSLLRNVSAFVEGEVLRLKVELLVQLSQVEQAKRALEVSMLNRTAISDHLEAEKTLLLGTIRLKAVQEEIQKWSKMQFLQNNCLEEESGSAVIKEMTITLDNALFWRSYYFILVAVERDNVRGSELCHLESPVLEYSQINFSSPLYFSNLRPDFQITFYLYGITTKDAKFKFLHRSNERLHFLHRPLKNKRHNSLVEGIEHNFQLIGISEVHSSHFKKKDLFLTTMVPNLTDKLLMNLKGAVYLDTRHCGFLDVKYCSDEQPSVWTKYWCRLSGLDLMGWTAPDHSDEDPKLQICLSDCKSHEVGPVSRFVCVRPHTFSMSLKMTNSSVVQQLWCGAESLSEMELWCHHINKILKTSRLWNSWDSQ